MEFPRDDERVRDHLANERTFLAWLRTGIATMGFGVVIAKLRYLFPPNSLAPPSRGIIHASNIGLLFVIVGLVTVALASRRFLTVQRQIRAQRYQASPILALGVAAVVAALGLLIIWYLLDSSHT